ncbi:MsnO8 family LLM class oxidoreductase [Microbacterium betulae]|uniref:MsnO8 family LLM class oxidoreductase n=1 Tax=Microbacterium betulae TaxID=2981139 RepID=A0AA97FEV6_9MICO|nr:MsnO8 family LLM class oxidoreductase [Microbacterium sp. AB]WOF22346.1 MsnO8 family LLM class oxidoreductase [Microbacterium sp. AB]
MSAVRPLLGVLDLAVIPEGHTAPETLRGSVALAEQAEGWGYHRYWLAEHHLTAGIASVNPVPVLAAAVQRTSRIRIGSAATLTGHRTAVSIAEDFATLAAFAPGRVDLGFGRSAARGREAPGPRGRAHAVLASPRFARRIELLQQRDALAEDHGALIRDVRAFLADEFADDDATRWSALPGGAQVELWSMGSSAGESARIAGEIGLPFAANHHMSPETAGSAVEHYRAVSAEHGHVPRVAVSVEACVAEDDREAQRLADAHLEWVRRQRAGEGITPFPSSGPVGVGEDPSVADRATALIAATPAEAAARIRALATRLDADEVVVSILAHDLDRRAASYAALAEAWARG